MNKIKLIFAILRSRPVMYRITVHSSRPLGDYGTNHRALIIDSAFIAEEREG